MKKTLTVNLNNIVFHIDDDAYEMLQTYLAEIGEHFKSDEEKKEIMFDIEARIAELFTEKLQKNKNVINVNDVQEIIDVMGKPSQYANEDEEPEKVKSEKKQSKSRRFYRDPENAILGGIASGIAAYFGLDVTLVRILLVVSVFVAWGTFIPVYLIFWFVAPQAVTASQRLEMQGEDVTVDSIKTELNNAKNYVESEKFKQSASTIGDRIFEILRIFFKVLFGFVGGILGLVGVIIVGLLLFLLTMLIFEPTFINSIAPDFISNWSVVSPENAILIFISLILVIGCPIFMIVYGAIKLITGKKSTSHTAFIVLLILWLAGIFMFYSVGASTYLKLKDNNELPNFKNWINEDNSILKDEIRYCDQFTAIEVSGNIELIINQDSIQSVKVSSNEDVLSNVITKVENGVLKIYPENLFENRTIKVTVTSNNIQKLEAKGACTINSENQLLVTNLELKLVGASDAQLDVKVSETFDVEVIGASEATLTGTAKNFNARVIGASEIKASDLISSFVDVKANGASQADVYATMSLIANANGASDIDCKGGPKNVKQSDFIGSSIHVE